MKTQHRMQLCPGRNSMTWGSVYWQKEIVEDGRFSFLGPPGFSGNGLIYTVEANLTATDFEATEEAEAVNDSAEGIG